MIEKELEFFNPIKQKLATPTGTPSISVSTKEKTKIFSPKSILVAFIGLNIALVSSVMFNQPAPTIKPNAKTLLNMNTIVKVSDVENAKGKPVVTEQDAKLYFINQRLEEQKAAEARRIRIGGTLWN